MPWILQIMFRFSIFYCFLLIDFAGLGMGGGGSKIKVRPGHHFHKDWVFTLETDTETFSSLVSSSRLRPRLKFLESRDREFDETFSSFLETETELFIFLRLRLG